jgi:hypothetical protein
LHLPLNFSFNYGNIECLKWLGQLAFEVHIYIWVLEGIGLLVAFVLNFEVTNFYTRMLQSHRILKLILDFNTI